MSRSVGITYAITGAVVAASIVAVTAGTLGLDGDRAGRGADAVGFAVPAGIAPGSATGAVVPAGALQPGEQVVRSEVVQTAGGPVEYVYVDAPAAARRHDGDDDDDDDERKERDHEKREERERGSRLFRREAR